MSATALALPSEQVIWRPRVNPWAIAATVSMAAFVEVLDTSVANVALPYIAGGLGASYDDSTRPSAGIRHVLVNGTFVVRDGDVVTDARPGRPVRADPR